MIWRVRTAVLSSQGFGGPAVDSWIAGLSRAQVTGRLLDVLGRCGYGLDDLEQNGVEIVLTSLLGRQTRVAIVDYRRVIDELEPGVKLNNWSLFRASRRAHKRRLAEAAAAEAAKQALVAEQERLEELAATQVRPGSLKRPSGLAGD